MKRLLELIDAYREANPDPETGRRLPRHKVAEAAGLSPGVVSHWKKGRQEPKIGSITKMCEFLDVDLSEIFDVSEKSTARVAGRHQNIVLVDFSDGEQERLDELEQKIEKLKAKRNLDDESLWKVMFIRGDKQWENFSHAEKTQELRGFLTYQIDELEKERVILTKRKRTSEKPSGRTTGVRKSKLPEKS